jgi:hypothetical protein
MTLAGSFLSSVSPALAASPPLTWASPVRVDDQPPFESSTAITGVACPSMGLCVAVDGVGDVLSTTDPTGGAGSWVTAASVAEGFAAVSCPSTELCVAVGGGDVAISTDLTGGAGAWTVTTLIPPASQHPNQPNRLQAVSCPSARLCVATDEAGNVWTSTDPTGVASAWTKANVDGSEKILSGVSCPTESLCVAVDREGGDVVTSTDPTGGAGAWTVTEVDKYTLFDVSCSSETLCVATDSYGNVLTSTDPTGGAGAWSPTQVSGGSIQHVSCASGGLCVASGAENEVISSTDPTGGASAWTATQIDLPSSYGGQESIDDVSCPPEGSPCVLTDSGSSVVTSTNPMGGADAWTITKLEVGVNWLQGVSCAPAGLCVGVDTAGNVVGSADPVGGPSAWSSAHVDGHPLDGVSCPSSGLCVAIDENGDVVTSTEPTGGPSAWSLADVDGTTPLHGISCPSTTLCVATDKNGDVVTSTEPTGGASAWHVASIADGELKGVSCPSEELCVVSGGGHAIVSTDPAGGASAWTTTSGEVFASISCPTAKLCASTGIEVYSVVTSTEPAGGKSAWTKTFFNPEDFNGFYRIACGSETLCVATTLSGNGSPGNVMISSNPTGGAEAWTEAEVYGGPIVKPIPIIELYSRVLTGVSCTPDLCAVIDNSGKVIVGTLPSPNQTGGGEQGGGGQSGTGQTGGSTTPTGPSPSILPPAPVSGTFSISGVKVGSDGQIVLALEAPAAGSIDATASLRMTTVGSRKRKTKPARNITYGTASATALGADTMTVTIKPTKSALSALKSSRTLRVPVTVIFHPRSGSPTTVSETVTVRYQRPRRPRACSASKGACRGKR